MRWAIPNSQDFSPYRVRPDRPIDVEHQCGPADYKEAAFDR